MDDTTADDRHLLARVTGLMMSISDAVRSSEKCSRMSFECHSICRAVRIKIPSLKLQDGLYFGLTNLSTGDEPSGKRSFSLRTCGHSWLVTPDGAIIDPYPVAYISANPVLVVSKGTYSPFGGGMYVPDRKVADSLANRRVWRKSCVLASLLETR